MRALVTRPLEDAKPLAEALAARGIDCVIEPLLEIVPVDAAEIDLDGVQAVLFTSANGVRAFAAKTDRRDLRVLAVGEASASTAREVGFTEVDSAGGDAEALATLAVDRLDPKSGPVFHAAGSVLAGDLQERLEQAGFTVRRELLYELRAAQSLSPETRMNLALGGIDAVLLFSPRTARTFAELWQSAGAPSLAKTTALALSAAVAREVGGLGWREVETAERPDQEAMIALIDSLKAETAQTGPEIAAGRSKEPMAEKSDTVASSQPRPHDQPKKTGAILAGALAGAVAAVIVTGLMQWFGSAPAVTSNTEAVDALDKRLAALEQSGADPALSVNAAEMLAAQKDELAAAKDRIQKLEDQLTKLASAPAQAAATIPAIDLAPFEMRLKQIEERVSRAANAAPANGANTNGGAIAAPDAASAADLARIAGDNAALRQDLAAAQARIAALDALSLDKLGERLGKVEDETASLTGKVGEIAGKPSLSPRQQLATAMVVAGADLRSALSSDKPFAATLSAIDELAKRDPEIATSLAPILAPLQPIAATGAPTLSQLQASLPSQAIAQAASAEGVGDAVGAESAWSDRLLARLSEVITVRPVGGEAEGDGSLARLARGEAKLQSGDLSGTVDELAGLTGKAAEAAAGWLGQARARLALDTADSALATIGTRLLAPDVEVPGGATP